MMAHITLIRMTVSVLSAAVIMGCGTPAPPTASRPTVATIASTPVAPPTAIAAVASTPTQSIAATSVPQPTEIPVSPTPSAQSTLTILPLNYEVKDAGDGWNDATIDLVYKNTSDQAIPPICLILLPQPQEDYKRFTGDRCGNLQLLIIKQAIVETREGKNYPVEKAEGTSVVINIGDPNFAIPPGIPFKHEIFGLGSFGKSTDRLSFRFAQAAHPTRLVLQVEPNQGYSDITFDLEAVPQQFPAPDWSQYQVKPISDLAKAPLVDNPDGLKVTFDGKCFYGPVSGFEGQYAHIPFSVINRNTLDESQGSIVFAYAAYYPDGLFAYQWRDLILFEALKAGPGQTEQHEVTILDRNPTDVLPTHLFLYKEEGKFRSFSEAYELKCSKAS